MSLQDGMAAINLEAPSRIPRTEYSAESHWDLIKVVTGIDVDHTSNGETQTRASRAFMKAWNYDLIWNTNVGKGIFGGYCTDMGHAEYAAGGVDYSNVIQSPFKDVDDVLNFDPAAKYKSINRAEFIKSLNESYADRVKENPDLVNMRGVYVSCVSGLIDMFGWELLLEACGTDPEKFGQVTNRYGDFIYQYFEALAACDSKVIMVHDDICWTSGQIFSTEWYQRFVFPNLKKCIAPLVEAGKKVLFTSDGTYTMFLDDIAKMGVTGFVMEPTTSLEYAAEKFGKTHVLIGNADTDRKSVV